MEDKLKRHEELCKEIHETFVAKNNDYGDSVHELFEKLGPVTLATRLGDKYNRICSLLNKGLDKQLVKSESILDTFLDLANYAIIGYIEMEKYLNNFSQYPIDRTQEVNIVIEKRKQDYPIITIDHSNEKETFYPEEIIKQNSEINIAKEEESNKQILTEVIPKTLEKIENSLNKKYYKHDKFVTTIDEFVDVIFKLSLIKSTTIDIDYNKLIQHFKVALINDYNISDSKFTTYLSSLSGCVYNSLNYFYSDIIGDSIDYDISEGEKCYRNKYNLLHDNCIVDFESNLITFETVLDEQKECENKKQISTELVATSFSNFINEFIEIYIGDTTKARIFNEYVNEINEKFYNELDGYNIYNGRDKCTTLDSLISVLISCISTCNNKVADVAPPPIFTKSLDPLQLAKQVFKRKIINTYNIDEDQVIYNTKEKYIKFKVIK